MTVYSYLIEYNRYLNIVGIGAVILLAYICSVNRLAVRWRLVFMALLMQFGIGFFMLRTSIGLTVVGKIATVVGHLYQAAEVGSRFIFGSLVDASGPWGFIFAVKVLPIIIFFGSFMAMLFYLGLIQPVVRCISVIVRPLLGTSGAETLCAIANSFLGQTEAPLLIRHYLPHMTNSEMAVVMISGMGTISGSILVVFAAMGVPTNHLLTASVMAIPATILIAKILYPETEKPQTSADVQISAMSESRNVLDAIAQGTSDGLQLALNVGAMLVSFLALIAIINGLLGWVTWIINSTLMYYHSTTVLPTLSLNFIFSYIFAPFAYLLGFVGHEAYVAAQLLGTKVTINELVAYSQMVAAGLSERTIAIMTYALCGFSNFSCIGIQLGGIGALVPQKRGILSSFGLRAVLGGALANILSAIVVGLLL